jgi:hypothetical protein
MLELLLQYAERLAKLMATTMATPKLGTTMHSRYLDSRKSLDERLGGNLHGTG